LALFRQTEPFGTTSSNHEPPTASGFEFSLAPLALDSVSKNAPYLRPAVSLGFEAHPPKPSIQSRSSTLASKRKNATSPPSLRTLARQTQSNQQTRGFEFSAACDAPDSVSQNAPSLRLTQIGIALEPAI
jgi:outer membrane receptor protein involved in Fe transport